MVMMNLVKVDDVLVLHLSENVDLLLNVPHGHPPPGGLHPLLLDVPDHSNYSLHTHSSINTQAADSLHGHDYHTNGYHRQGLEPSSRLIINESNLLGGILSLCTSFNDAMYNGKLTTAKSHLQNNHNFTDTQESVRYSEHEQHKGAAN